MPGWRNGRRAWLRTRCRKTWEFESPSGYQLRSGDLVARCQPLKLMDLVRFQAPEPSERGGTADAAGSKPAGQPSRFESGRSDHLRVRFVCRRRAWCRRRSPVPQFRLLGMKHTRSALLGEGLTGRRPPLLAERPQGLQVRDLSSPPSTTIPRAVFRARTLSVPDWIPDRVSSVWGGTSAKPRLLLGGVRARVRCESLLASGASGRDQGGEAVRPIDQPDESIRLRLSPLVGGDDLCEVRRRARRRGASQAADERAARHVQLPASSGEPRGALPRVPRRGDERAAPVRTDWEASRARKPFGLRTTSRRNAMTPDAAARIARPRHTDSIHIRRTRRGCDGIPADASRSCSSAGRAI